MIKVSVMYPYRDGARFDHTYYSDTHMPLVSARMGAACLSYTVDKGISGGEPGSTPPYIGMCHIFCDSVEAFNGSFGRTRPRSLPISPTTPISRRSCRSATWSWDEHAIAVRACCAHRCCLIEQRVRWLMQAAVPQGC